VSPLAGFHRGLPGHPQDLPDLPFAWLEAPLEARLGWTRETDWNDLDRWPAGRIFGEAGEYRWQRTPSGVHAVLVLDEGALPAPFTGEVELESLGDADLVLWGEWIDPARDAEGNPEGMPVFYAQEIPEPQLYPLERNPEKGESPRLHTRTYTDAAGEKGEFVRCVGIFLKKDEGQEDG
jgi:hypothetical protein